MKRTIRILLVGALVGAGIVLGGCALFDPAPVAAFSWTPLEPLARIDIQFTDQSTDSGFLGAGGIVSWSWDFDDSNTSSAQNPKHRYEKSGTYDVRLTVTDKSGNTAVVQRTINVSASLDGRWAGNITDGNYQQWTLGLDINHSSTGGISGTATIGSSVQVITSASLDPDTGEVQIHCSAFGLILRGDLNATETRMSGYWYDDWTGERWEDWSVTLQ